MSIQTPQPSSVYANLVLAALQQTGIQQTAEGGKARAFADITGDQIAILDAAQFSNLTQTLVPFATSDSLDYLGQIYGVTRIAQQDASAQSTDNNFEFYVNSGTFGSINNGQDINVPAGTLLFTSDPNGPTYVVSGAVTLPAAQSSVYFSADAVTTGSAANAAQDAITQHNFTNYANSVYGTLLVTNNYGVVSGRDQENDDSYRYRIQLSLQSKGGAAESDLRLALLEIPGIQDIVFNPLAGTFQVFIYGISSLVSPVTIQLAQASIDDNTAYPLSGLAIAPDIIGISLVTALTLTPGLSDSDKSTVVSAASAAASNYINNLGVGNTFYINTLADQIQNADSRILDIGTPDDPITQIFIWRPRSDGTRYSRTLVNNYTPAIGERIATENITNAINLTVN